MGHKAIAVIDLDNLDLIDRDPAEFVRRFKIAILTHRGLGGSVTIGGGTVANVVWSGHTDLSPVLKFVDFHVENESYRSGGVFPPIDERMKTDNEILAECQELMKVGGRRVEAVRKYRIRFKCDLKTAMNALGASYTSGITE